MTKPKFFTPKFKKNAIDFLVYFLALAVTPIIAKPFALLFNWLGYTFLRTLYEEIFTAIFWGVEAIGLHHFRKRIRLKRAIANGKEIPVKRKKKKKKSAKEDCEIVIYCSDDEAAPVEKRREKPAKVKKEPAPLLPLQNVFLLTLLCAVCVLVISAVIGFKVKPFYDLGEKFNGFQMWCEIGVIGRNALKCIWITAMLGACKGMADEIVATVENAKPVHAWLITCGLMLIFALFDVFASVVEYPMEGQQWLIALVYFLFYIAFVLIYYLTKEHKVKSYFLIMFIYLF